jgi:predicted ester cyclase
MEAFIQGNTRCCLADFCAKCQTIHNCQPTVRFESCAYVLPKENDMTSKLDVVRTYINAAWTNPPSSNMEASATYLSDDFQSLDEDGNVAMNKEAYIGMVQLLFAAFKDFKWVRSDLRQEGDSVIMSGHFEGTHTSDLDLSAMGLGVIPARGKMIVWPEASVEYKVEGDKIVSEKAYGDSGGMESFLAALGVVPTSA